MRHDEELAKQKFHDKSHEMRLADVANDRLAARVSYDAVLSECKRGGASQVSRAHLAVATPSSAQGTTLTMPEYEGICRGGEADAMLIAVPSKSESARSARSVAAPLSLVVPKDDPAVAVSISPRSQQSRSRSRGSYASRHPRTPSRRATARQASPRPESARDASVDPPSKRKRGAKKAIDILAEAEAVLQDISFKCSSEALWDGSIRSRDVANACSKLSSHSHKCARIAPSTGGDSREDVTTLKAATIANDLLAQKEVIEFRQTLFKNIRQNPLTFARTEIDADIQDHLKKLGMRLLCPMLMFVGEQLIEASLEQCDRNVGLLWQFLSSTSNAGVFFSIFTWL